MKPALSGSDTKPWYRHFWLWFLILLPASVVVASLVTMYIAYYGADDLVVDEYYKDGLAINRQLEKIQRSTELGISAEVSFSSDYVTAHVEGPVNAPSLNLLLSHPLEADRDFPLSLSQIAPGIYQAPLPAAVAPRWHWTLSLPQPDGWRLDGIVQHLDSGDAGSD